MKFKKLTKIIITALFTAIICVATYVVQIPMPATGGYVNLGDCFVLTAGLFLGAGYGAIAAGLGSAIADIIAGYVQYAPATFLIKALMATVVFAVYKLLNKSFVNKLSAISKLIGGICAEAVMILGYFCYEAVILKYEMGAAGSIGGNVMQGIVGTTTAFALATAFEKVAKKSKVLSSIFMKG